MLKKAAIVALVDKETCLLPLEPVHMKLQSVFNGYVSLIFANDIIILRVELRLVRKGGL